MIKKTFLATSVILFLIKASMAKAADFDFSGTFTNDNDVLGFNFTVTSDSTITIFSSSWDDGGFDPILAIWDNLGNLIEQQDDGQLVGTEISNGVSYDYGVWDSYYTQFLTAGTYTATVAQFDNFSLGTKLSQGFTYDSVGNENFTSRFGCSNGQFCGYLSDNRTSEWVFHILNVDDATIVDPPVTTTTPEPPSLLGLLGIFIFYTTLKQRKKLEV